MVVVLAVKHSLDVVVLEAEGWRLQSLVSSCLWSCRDQPLLGWFGFVGLFLELECFELVCLELV